MEPTTVRSKIASRIQHMVGNAIIKDRRFLDDEQLIRSEQLAVLEEIFNANVRDTEIQELMRDVRELKEKVRELSGEAASRDRER